MAPRTAISSVFVAAALCAAIGRPAAAEELPLEERAKIEGYVALLGDDRADTRIAAERSLESMGERARPFLVKARTTPVAEVRRRVDALLARLDAAADADAAPWTGLRGGPGRTGVIAGELPRTAPAPAWRVEVPDDDPLQGALLATADRVVSLSKSGVVRSYRASDGARQWLADTGDVIGASAAIGRGRIVVPTAAGVCALGTDDGRLVWRVDSEYGCTAAPAVVGDRVWIALTNAGVRALDVRTGEQLVERKLAPRGAVLADHDLVVVGGVDGILRSLDPATGRDRWTTDLGEPPLMGPTLAANGVLVVLSKDRVLRGIRTADGRETWKVILPSLSPSESLAASAGRVFTTDARGAVRTFDAATGRELWMRNEGFIEMGAPCATPTTVVYGARGRIGARDADSGDFLWRVDVDRADCASPVAAAGRLFVLYDGQLRCWQ